MVRRVLLRRRDLLRLLVHDVRTSRLAADPVREHVTLVGTEDERLREASPHRSEVEAEAAALAAPVVDEPGGIGVRLVGEPVDRTRHAENRAVVERRLAAFGVADVLVTRLACLRHVVGEPLLVAGMVFGVRAGERDAVNVHQQGDPALAHQLLLGWKDRICSGTGSRHIHHGGEPAFPFRHEQQPVDSSAVERREAHVVCRMVGCVEFRRRRLLHRNRDLAFKARELAAPVRLEIRRTRRERLDVLHAEDHPVHPLPHGDVLSLHVDAQRTGRIARELHLDARLFGEIDGTPPDDIRPAVVHPHVDDAFRRKVAVLVRDIRLHFRRTAHWVEVRLHVKAVFREYRLRLSRFRNAGHCHRRDSKRTTTRYLCDLMHFHFPFVFVTLARGAATSPCGLYRWISW